MDAQTLLARLPSWWRPRPFLLVMSPAVAGVWCQHMPQIQNDTDCQYVNYVSCDPVGMDYAVPADGHTCSFETSLSEPLCAITDDMTYQEKIEVVAVDVTPSAVAGVASPVFGVSICLRFRMIQIASMLTT